MNNNSLFNFKGVDNFKVSNKLTAKNLIITGDLSLGGNTNISVGSSFDGNLDGILSVSGTANINGSVSVDGNSLIINNVLSVGGRSHLNDDVSCGFGLSATQGTTNLRNANLSSNLSVGGETTLNSLSINGTSIEQFIQNIIGGAVLGRCITALTFNASNQTTVFPTGQHILFDYVDSPETVRTIGSDIVLNRRTIAPTFNDSLWLVDGNNFFGFSGASFIRRQVNSSGETWWRCNKSGFYRFTFQPSLSNPPGFGTFNVRILLIEYDNDTDFPSVRNGVVQSYTTINNIDLKLHGWTTFLDLEATYDYTVSFAVAFGALDDEGDNPDADTFTLGAPDGFVEWARII